uniref:Protein FAM50 homolog n=1 Tax=Plectus sambesii TaxID=2011161 RepID=A0A914WCP6_9BILA
MASTADAGRLIHLAKRREREKEDIEKQRKKIQDESQNISGIGEKFTAHYDAIEQSLKSDTIGLVTLDQMRAKQQDFIQQRENQLAHKNIDPAIRKAEAEKEAERLKRLADDHKRRVLSFDVDEDVDDDDEDDDDDGKDEDEGKKEEVDSGSDSPGPSKASKLGLHPPPAKMKKLGKDPTVDTSFLPDREREQEENRLREQLRQEWSADQERQKSEDMNIAFSYWDGSGHRRDTQMKKGSSIGQFLSKALEILRKDFTELKSVSAESLMFVKEDLIIPHFYTFQDFIVTKAMGKTGPLFEFDAAAELRVRHDAAQDTAESHPAKVVLRSWYEKNKHIYPASRWEPFVPNKKYKQTFDDLKSI